MSRLRTFVIFAAPLVLTSATLEPSRPTEVLLAATSIPTVAVVGPQGIDQTPITRALTSDVRPLPRIEEVRWTVEHGGPLRDVASRFGIPARALTQLNPSFRSERARIDSGTEVLVFRRDPEHPTRSIGAPNRGRLDHGVPLPEGPHWQFRDYRAHAFGSRPMVEALVRAFERYGERFPEGPTIRLGDLSSRRGGKLFPHVSHRTGRDIDIGFVLHEEHQNDRWWQRANEDSFDVEKNWVLVKALIDTGRVQQIFMSSRLQRLLLERARTEMSPEELARVFRLANPDPSAPSIIRHWKGHADHMHVRFECEPGNARCVSQSIQSEM